MIILPILAIAFSFTWAIPAEVNSHWNNFKLSHAKKYSSQAEEAYRFKVFHENLKTIEEHNKLYDAGLSTYKMGVNKFADLTTEEFVALSSIDISKKISQDVFRAQEDEDLPEHVDWREKGAVNEIRNQGSCGSCWAHTAIECLESLLFLKVNRLVTLSVQNLVDCATPYGTYGCRGGFMTLAYDYIKENGIMYEVEYPYTEKDGECKFNATRSALKVTGHVTVEDNEQALKAAIAKIGPIGVAVSTQEWHLYSKGILIPTKPFVGVNHGVVADGYGTEDGVDYWLLRNSYGREFGEDGYIRVARNQGESIGVTSGAVYPTLPY